MTIPYNWVVRYLQHPRIVGTVQVPSACDTWRQYQQCLSTHADCPLPALHVRRHHQGQQVHILEMVSPLVGIGFVSCSKFSQPWAQWWLKRSRCQVANGYHHDGDYQEQLSNQLRAAVTNCAFGLVALQGCRWYSEEGVDAIDPAQPGSLEHTIHPAALGSKDIHRRRCIGLDALPDQVTM